MTNLPRVHLDLATRARLRVWAAEVRDQHKDHAAVSSAACDLAKTLCSLLDIHESIQADNARDSNDTSIALVLGMLVLSGQRPPA
jgi:hypothetical protein